MKQIILLLGAIILLQLLWIANDAWKTSERYDPYDALHPAGYRPVFKPTNILREYDQLCAQYNRKGYYPAKEGECPDSSFTYVANVAANVPGSNNRAPGCVQLKESPFCAIQPDGTYRPNFVKLLYRQSP